MRLIDHFCFLINLCSRYIDHLPSLMFLFLALLCFWLRTMIDRRQSNVIVNSGEFSESDERLYNVFNNRLYDIIFSYSKKNYRSHGNDRAFLCEYNEIFFVRYYRKGHIVILFFDKLLQRTVANRECMLLAIILSQLL